MREYNARIIGFKKDGLSAAKFVGMTREGYRIEISNCHLITPPYEFHLGKVCLYGYRVMFDGVYHYPNAYLKQFGDCWTIIVRRKY